MEVFAIPHFQALTSVYPGTWLPLFLLVFYDEILTVVCTGLKVMQDMAIANHVTWKERIDVLEARIAPEQLASFVEGPSSSSSAPTSSSERDMTSDSGTAETEDEEPPDEQARRIAALFASPELHVPRIFVPAHGSDEGPLSPSDALREVHQVILTCVQASLVPQRRRMRARSEADLRPSFLAPDTAQDLPPNWPFERVPPS